MTTGKVKRPTYDPLDPKNKELTLTATLTCGTIIKKISFPASVCMDGMSDTQSIIEDKKWLDGWILLISKDKIKGDISLPTKGVKGNCTITWSSSNPSYLSDIGIVIRPDNGEVDAPITLTATLTKGAIVAGDETNEKAFTLTVLAWNDADEVANDLSLVTWESCKGNNPSITQITNSANRVQIKNNMNLFNEVPDGLLVNSRKCSVAWDVIYTESYTKTFIATSGIITKPTYTEGDVSFSLRCTISKGSVTSAPIVILTYGMLPKLEITNDEVVSNIIRILTVGSNIKDISTINDIKLSGFLNPIAYPDLTKGTITWDIMNEANERITSPYASIETISNPTDEFLYNLKVTRPVSGEGNRKIILQAYVSSLKAAGSFISSPKIFNVNIIQETESAPV